MTLNWNGKKGCHNRPAWLCSVLHIINIIIFYLLSSGQSNNSVAPQVQAVLLIISYA